jgi:hypothetical protein
MTNKRQTLLLAAAVAAVSMGAMACDRTPPLPGPAPTPPPNTIAKPCDDCHGDDPGEPGYPGSTVAPNS